MVYSDIRINLDQIGNYIIDDSDSNGKLVLSDLKKVNLLIGQNNSGKSRLLRSLFRMDFNDNTSEGLHTTEALLSRLSKMNMNVFNGLIEGVKSFEETYLSLDDLASQYDYISKLNLDSEPDRASLNEDEYNGLMAWLKIASKSPIIKYIPIQRSIVPITPFHFEEDDQRGKDTLMNKIFNTYFFGNDKKRQNIFTGESFYDILQDMLLSNYKDRKLINDFEMFLSNSFFNGNRVSLIPRKNNDKKKENEELQLNIDKHIFVKIGNELERDIMELGDGVANTILLTFPLFISRDQNQVILIEEPENCLHPGFLRFFIKTILDDVLFPYTQVFLTTHSNHVLDMFVENIDKMALFSLRKEFRFDSDAEYLPKFYIHRVKMPEVKILDDLGVHNGSILQVGCTIWVDGVTDRLYLKKYLEIYIKNFNEQKDVNLNLIDGLHYSFFEFSGTNLQHYNFSLKDFDPESISAFKLSNRIFLIGDADYSNGEIPGWKKDRIELFTKLLGENFYVLKSREIENVVKPEILRDVINEECLNKGWYLNDDFCQRITIGDKSYPKYYMESVGLAIDDHLVKIKDHIDVKSKPVYSVKKSLNSQKKKAICEKVVAKVNQLTDLSPEALHLTENIFNFILRSNHITVIPST